MRTFAIVSWLSLLLGIGAWAGIYFFYETIQGMEVARVQRLHSIEQSTLQDTSTARVKALAAETKDGRAALAVLTSTELLSTVKIIENVGKPIGLTVRVDNVSPSPAAKSSSLNSVSFALDSQASYAALMRLMQLFESIPLPSVVEDVSLNKQSSEDPKADASKALWDLSLHLRVYTTANVSS